MDAEDNLVIHNYPPQQPWPSVIDLLESAPPDVTAPTVSTFIIRDALGRPIEETQDSDGLSVFRTYDEVGNVLSTRRGGSHQDAFEYEYDSRIGARL